MYRDVAQWSSIRQRIPRKGVSIRQVVRETGISRKTVRKMLNHPLPKPYGPRSRRCPKLGPHYARPIASDNGCIWEYAYALLASLEKRRAIELPIPRCPVPIRRSYPPDRTQQFFRDAGRVISVAPTPDRRAQARQAAFEWMRAVLQEGHQPRCAAPRCRRLGKRALESHH